MVHHKRSHRRKTNRRKNVRRSRRSTRRRSNRRRSRNVRKSRRSIRRNVRRSKRSRRMVGGWGAKKVGEKMYGGANEERKPWNKKKIPSFKLYGGGWPRQEPFIV